MREDVYNRIVSSQKELCQKYEAGFLAPKLASKLGISADAMDGKFPIHGLRHAPEGGTCGWYIWSGEYSDDPGFFLPLHVEHVISDSSPFAEFLGLSPGWRFLIADGGYQDVWFDPNILHRELGSESA